MSKTLEGYLNWVKTCEQYESSTKNIWKLSDLTRNIRKVLNSTKITRHYSFCTQSISKRWSLKPKTFGKYLIFTQVIRFYEKCETSIPNIRKVSDFGSFLRKLLNLYPKHWNFIVFVHRHSKSILFLSKVCQKIFYVFPKHLKSIVYWLLTGSIQNSRDQTSN